MELKALRALAANCSLCELHKGRMNPVFDKGSEGASIFICGMVPAYEENKQGLPFVGRAGLLLDEIIRESGIEDVYITNVVKCFLAPGIPLKSDWIDPCIPYLVAQLGIIKPKVVLTLGADATNALMGYTLDTKIGSLRGKLLGWGSNMNVIPTYHPSFLLRGGGTKSKFYSTVIEDFILAKKNAKEL